MTTMTEQATQVYSLFIRSSAERIWDAITKPEFTAQYFYGSLVDSTFEAGAPFRGWSPDRSEQWVDGEIALSEPPKKLQYSWRALYDEETAAEPYSRVTWELEPQDGGVTKLTVVHDRLEESPKTAANVAGGWMFILSGPKTLLETGKPLQG